MNPRPLPRRLMLMKLLLCSMPAAEWIVAWLMHYPSDFVGDAIVLLGTPAMYLLLNWMIRERFFGFRAYPERSRVSVAPGTRMASLARWLVSKKQYERVYAPLIADLQHEYIEALKDGAVVKVKWIRVRYLFAFAKALLIAMPLGVVKTVVEAWKASQ